MTRSALKEGRVLFYFTVDLCLKFHDKRFIIALVSVADY